jgi:hypothetical protein
LEDWFQVSSLKTWASASSCVYLSNYCVMGLELLRYLLPPKILTATRIAYWGYCGGVGRNL